MEKPIECTVIMAGRITVEVDTNQLEEFDDCILIRMPGRDALRAISPLIYKQVYIVDVKEGVPELF